jgi:hypothetical protein
MTHANGLLDAAHTLTSAAAIDLSDGVLALGSDTAATSSRIDALFSVTGGGVLELNHVMLGGTGT